MKRTPFSRRALTVLLSLMGVSFLSGLVFMIFGREMTAPPTWGSDSYSRSALGFHGFFTLLDDSGVPVIRRRRSSSDADVVALLAPRDHSHTETTLERAIDVAMGDAGTVLVVLPKWDAYPHMTKPGWVEDRELASSDTAREVLKALGLGATNVVRLGADRAPDWRTDELPNARLEIERVQLLNEGEIEPLLWCDEGVLVGYVDRYYQHILVVADPDLFNNYGLGRAENALVTWAIVERLRGREDAAIVVDERIHGHQVEKSFMRELFDFPLLLATLQALIFFGVVLWATTGRFGKTVPAPRALGRGKRSLIENTARLMHLGGHTAFALRRYFNTTARHVAVALHVPIDQERGDVLARLKELGHSRGATEDPIELAHLVGEAKDMKNEAHVMEVARRIHRWRGEMIHGSGSDSRQV